MFEMNVNSQKKVFIIKVAGFIQEEEAKKFMEAYNKNINSFKASEYSLILVADELSASKPEMIPALEGVVNLYKSTGFKNYYSTTPKSAVTSMQLKRVANHCGMNIIFEPTVEDVLKKL
jgi:anti-anti-sigma regulatory factor